jgi:hypothetical protein
MIIAQRFDLSSVNWPPSMDAIARQKYVGLIAALILLCSPRYYFVIDTLLMIRFFRNRTKSRLVPTNLPTDFESNRLHETQTEKRSV